MGVRSDGSLFCWGNNQVGQLGDGTTINSLVPKQEITYSVSWTSVAAGEGYSTGIKSDKTLWVWGSNGSGQLGIGNHDGKLTPVQVP
ncbi:MAG: hypothetical protein K8I03_12285 [Ignavibacteria bacterium]|nr:hypothetical protein [Ignavibacteria bacterium]